jgi:hypothetical protein
MQDYIPFFQAEKRSIAEKLAKYFEYSGLEAKIHFDEERDSYIVSVPAQKEKEAKKFYQAFYFVERDRIENEEKSRESLEEYNESNIISGTSEDDSAESSLELSNEEIASTDIDALDSATVSDPDEATDEADNATSTDDVPNDFDVDEKALVKDLLSESGTYVMKSEKYKDYVSTQYVFLILGIAGIIFVFLNVIGVLSVLYGLFPNLVMGALFIFFFFVGITTGKKARLLKKEIDDESQLTAKITEWLHTNVTEEFLSTISNPDLSEELDYIKKTDTIRDMLIKEFGEQNRDYLDRLIEDFYSETFDTSKDYIEDEAK